MTQRPQPPDVVVNRIRGIVLAMQPARPPRSAGLDVEGQTRAALRREIHEGLNVVELWNGVNDFIFFGRGREFATNRREDQEISMLCLHLLQNCLVYLNTLMMQRVLGEADWRTRLTDRDRQRLSPFVHAHVNPYGRFDLDLDVRLAL